MTERFLANENFPAEIVRYLRDRGDDVLFAAEDLIGAADESILAAALAQDRVVLTFDRDFGELVFRRRQPRVPGIVLFRLRQQPPEVVLGFLRTFFAARPELKGRFTVSSPGQLRQIPLQP